MVPSQKMGPVEFSGASGNRDFPGLPKRSKKDPKRSKFGLQFNKTENYRLPKFHDLELILNVWLLPKGAKNWFLGVLSHFWGCLHLCSPLVSTVIKTLWYDTSPNKLQPAHKFLRIFINRYVTGMHFGEHSFAFFGIFCRNGQKELSWKFGTFFCGFRDPQNGHKR